MRTLKKIILLPLIILTVHCNAGHSPLGPEDDYKPPSRVLFVGNSLTGFNDGVDEHLAGLVAAADSLPQITAEAVWSAGASFRNHWFNDDTKNTIWNGEWDVVVLQEHSRLSITDTENMYTYARLLDELIHKSGASTVFFMTWAWRDEPEMIDRLVPVYQGIADELGASLAPVGLAWRRSFEENPDLDLYSEDGYHPNYRGTYLAACVFYALLWKSSPEGIPYYGPRSVTPAEGKFLQRIAWETVGEEWNIAIDRAASPVEGVTFSGLFPFPSFEPLCDVHHRGMGFSDHREAMSEFEAGSFTRSWTDTMVHIRRSCGLPAA